MKLMFHRKPWHNIHNDTRKSFLLFTVSVTMLCTDEIDMKNLCKIRYRTEHEIILEPLVVVGGF